MIRGLLAWLFGPSLDTLLGRARQHGTVILQDVGASREHGSVTWSCSIRPHTREQRGLNSWTGSGPTPSSAVEDAFFELRNNPRLIQDPEANPRPMLGGKEYDG